MNPLTAMKKIILHLTIGFFALHAGAQDFQWVSQLSGLSEEIATDITVDDNGNRYVSGFFGNTMNLSGNVISSQGFRDGFVVKYNPSGQEIWHLQLGSILDDEIKRLRIDAQNRLYLLINHNDTLSLQGQVIFSASYWSVICLDTDGILLHHFDPFEEVPTHFTLTDMGVSPSGKVALTGDFGLATASNPTPTTDRTR